MSNSTYENPFDSLQILTSSLPLLLRTFQSKFYIYLDIVTILYQFMSEWVPMEYLVVISTILSICVAILYTYPPYCTARIEDGDDLFRSVSVWILKNVSITSYNITMSSLDNKLSARDNLDLKPTPDYYIGYGDHDFRYQFWRYRVTHAQSGTKSDTRSKNQSQESTQSLIINCYGFFPKEGIQKLLCDSADSQLLTKDNSKEKKTQFFEPSDIWARRFKNEHWRAIRKIPSRPLKHVFMDKTVKERIVLKFDTFYSQKDEDKKLYEELGYKHKLVCLFHGESGTGKTSTITSLAHLYQLNVCLVNLQKQNEEDLKMILHRIPESSMIVFEDIKPSTFEDYKPESNKEGISLATFLNMLDGLTSLEGSIIIMTTNYFQELHDFCPELLREGRVDEAVKFTYIDEEQAKSMFHAYTSPDTELTELDSESLDQGMEFGKLLDGMKVRHSAVQKYLLKWIKNSNGAFHHAEEWLDNMLAENSDKIKTQISEISHGPTMIDDIKNLEETGKLHDDVMVDGSKLATDDKEVDENRMADDVEMVDESKSLSDGMVGSESRLVDDTKMAGEIKVEDVVITKKKWWMNLSQRIRSRRNTNR